MNQKLKGDDISIDYAFLPKDGTIAIFAGDARGHMGKEPIGLVRLTAGDHYNVNVALSPLPKSGTKLWAVLERAAGRTHSLSSGRAGRASVQDAVVH